MSDTICILNSPELGGAERSFVIQLGLLKGTSQVNLMVPRVGDRTLSKELKDFIAENRLSKVTLFNYDRELYEVSRTSIKFKLIGIFIGMLEQILSFKISKIYEAKRIWCNGNKVFFPVYFGAVIFGYRGSLIWHWRDYPKASWYYKLLRFITKKFGKFKLVLAGNSNSVCMELKKTFKEFEICRLYNPVSLMPPEPNRPTLSGVIGFAGMTAPWKGLHELYLWSSLFEKDLRAIGVKEIAVFGKNIYLTKGEHTHYFEELKCLERRFPSGLISHKGLVSPKEIYSSIDIMLHLSNQMEPFGRVILESFAHGVPCISTGLGGAGELMKGIDELIHFSYDYAGLMNKVRSLMTDPELVRVQGRKGLLQFKHFQKLAETDLELFESAYFQ